MMGEHTWQLRNPGQDPLIQGEGRDPADAPRLYNSTELVITD